VFKNNLGLLQRWDYRYWIVVILIALFVTLKISNYPYRHTSDAWEHTAALQELSTNLTSPKNPNVASGAPTPRYMPYLLLLAVSKKLTGFDVFTVMRIASMLNLLLLSLAVFLFTREYFQDHRQPLYSLIVMLFFWGLGYSWSGAYQFSILPLVLPYPSTITFALSLLGLYFVLRAIKSNSLIYLVAIVVLGWFILLSHPLTGGFFFVSSFLLILFSESGDTRTKIKTLIPLLLVIPLSFLWPYYSIHKLFIGSVSSYEGYVDRSHFYSVKKVVTALGPGLLGVVFIHHYLVLKKYRFVTYGFLFFFFVYLLSFVWTIPLGWRFIFLFLFYLHLATARKLREMDLFSLESFKEAVFCRDDIRLFKVLMIAVVVISVAINVIIARPTTVLSRGAPIGAPLPQRYSFLNEVVDQYDVVLADDRTSWVIPSFSGKVVAFLRSNPLLRDIDERRRDHASFFSLESSEDVRKELISKYSVDFILLNLEFLDEEWIPEIEKLGVRVYETDQLLLFKTNERY
jgi:hypothetical protein